jgi:hypothetical protein
MTTPNVSDYPLDNAIYQSVEKPAYVDNYEMYVTRDLATWHSIWPQIRIQDDSNTSLGTGLDSFTLSSLPILPGSISLGASTGFNTSMQAFDDKTGGFVTSTGVSVSGAVDYETGEITNLATTGVVAGETINVNYYSYFASRPWAMLYWDNTLSFYPVPDRIYEVSMTVYKTPTELLSGMDTPELDQWWEALAYGAAMKIFEDNKDIESMSEMEVLLERKLNLLRRRTWYTLHNQRTATIYADPSPNPQLQGWGYIPGTF